MSQGKLIIFQGPYVIEKGMPIVCFIVFSLSDPISGQTNK